MRLTKWTKPGTNEVRYYFDVRFGGCKYLSRSENAALSGRWVAADDAGLAVSWQKPQHGIGMCRGEIGGHIDSRLGIAGMTFAAFEALYDASLTESGNFSEVRFFKAMGD